MIGATKSFRSEVDGDGVATITLDRPDRINSLTFEVYGELRDTFRWLKENGPEVRAIVLRGEGPKGFCSGGDQHDIIAELFSRDMQGLLEFTRMTGALVQAIRTTRPPVVAALHGVVCGAGAVIAAACDIRIGAKDTRFAYLFPKVGLCGADMGAAYLLPRLVGMGRATEILLTGDWVPAEEAHRIGLLNRVVEGDALREEADAFARKLAKGPAFAHAMTKRMLEYEAHVDFATAIEAEAQAQAICMQHPDFLEAHEAWKEKRAPRYR
ncbi:MAG: enoyl-CoA hydratase family protein [Sandaracinus sp.]|nr:enoyl-CoA hydratase family protein [Myxococcales bacterium]MCB9614931.1 enoyl-CoA hydratase family protein [Sandaracinus sp.]MCB9618688.1 enoyl-CoA hydratase family protein [Sandaracinus sp.]